MIVNGPVKAMGRILLPLQGPYDAEAAFRFLQLKPFHEEVELSLLTVLPTVNPVITSYSIHYTKLYEFSNTQYKTLIK